MSKEKDKIIEEQYELIENLSEELLVLKMELYAKEQKEVKSHFYSTNVCTNFNYVSSI